MTPGNQEREPERERERETERPEKLTSSFRTLALNPKFQAKPHTLSLQTKEATLEGSPMCAWLRADLDLSPVRVMQAGFYEYSG